MNIHKHDERLVKEVPGNAERGLYKYFLLDLSDTIPLKIPIKWVTESNGSIWEVITAQTLIALNRGDTADNPARYDADKLCIPGSVIKGDDGYYSVDYSKFDFTPTIIQK